MNFMKTTLMGLRLVCLTLFFASAFGAETLDRRIDAAPDGIVSIENTAGSVEVRGWSRNEVEVTGELGSDVEELVFERNGNTVVVHVRSASGSNRDISSDLVIRVPERSGVNINGISTDVNVRDVRGAQRLKTVSGDVDTQAFASDVDIEAISGDVAIEGDGEASRTRLNSVSGDIEAENLAGEIQANTVSGDLTVVGSRFERVHAESVSGDIVFRAALVGSGRMDMETINGEIDLVLEGDVSARFDIETFNGDIRNCFGPEPERTSRYTPGLELSFAEGDGDARVTINTLNGDVRLCKD
jgi:DUF4097 and DUF4098 domain-containing protein YvlB